MMMLLGVEFTQFRYPQDKTQHMDTAQFLGFILIVTLVFGLGFS